MHNKDRHSRALHIPQDTQTKKNTETPAKQEIGVEGGGEGGGATAAARVRI